MIAHSATSAIAHNGTDVITPSGDRLIAHDRNDAITACGTNVVARSGISARPVNKGPGQLPPATAHQSTLFDNNLVARRDTPPSG